MSPDVVIGVVAVFAIIAILAVILVPRLFDDGKPSLDHLVAMRDEQLRKAAHESSRGNHGLAEEHEKSAAALLEKIQRMERDA